MKKDTENPDPENLARNVKGKYILKPRQCEEEGCGELFTPETKEQTRCKKCNRKKAAEPKICCKKECNEPRFITGKNQLCKGHLEESREKSRKRAKRLYEEKGNEKNQAEMLDPAGTGKELSGEDKTMLIKNMCLLFREEIISAEFNLRNGKKFKINFLF